MAKYSTTGVQAIHTGSLYLIGSKHKIFNFQLAEAKLESDRDES